MNNTWNIQLKIRDAIKNQMPQFSNMFGDVKFIRIPNAPDDGVNGYEIYAAQCGDVTMLALHDNGRWSIKTRCW